MGLLFLVAVDFFLRLATPPELKGAMKSFYEASWLHGYFLTLAQNYRAVCG
jgi:hypothetical protein